MGQGSCRGQHQLELTVVMPIQYSVMWSVKGEYLYVDFGDYKRHGCGYALANAGHDTRALQAWLGHKNIQHTVRYTELAPDRFKDFWRD
jgi:Phage integrase family